MLERKRILLVDADELVLIRLEKMLEDAGFDTTTTWDPRHALAILTAGEFDLLLLGHHPPEVNAKELLVKVTALGRRPKCLVLQPVTMGDAGEFLRLGALEVVYSRSYDDVLRAINSQAGATPKAMAAAA
ncbi:MAG: hypothetical protein ACE14M_10595 [Terriglobales bacterium]